MASGQRNIAKLSWSFLSVLSPASPVLGCSRSPRLGCSRSKAMFPLLTPVTDMRIINSRTTRICFNYQLDADALSNERCLAVRDYSLPTIIRTKNPQGELPKCHGVCVPQHPFFAFATDWSEAHSWSEISCEGQKPAPRQAHSAVIGADGRMWVYGGNALTMSGGPPNYDSAFFKATMRCVAACHLMFSAAKT